MTIAKWRGADESWCECGRGEPSPGAAAPDLEWMLVGYRSPGSDVATVGAVPAQMWQGRAHGCFK